MLKRSLFLLGTGVSFAAFVASTGCGSSETGTGGSGTGVTAAAVTGTNATGKTVTSVTATAAGTGGGATGINTIDGAAATTVGTQNDGTFVDAMTPDYYSFTGTKGERLFVQAIPTGLTAADPTVTDPAFSLIDSSKNEMTPLDLHFGSWPDFGGQDTEAFYELPADGTYYIRVADCNGFFNNCPNPAADITTFDYSLIIVDTSMLQPPELVAAATQNGTTANSQAITYAVPSGGSAGQYGQNALGGDLKNATDTQVFSFTPPSDAVLSTGARARAEFYVLPIGTGTQNGDLSSANIKVWATDSTGTNIIAAADQNNYPTNTTAYTPMEFSVPYTVGQQYYLFVQNTHTGGTPATDFYFVNHILNPLIDVAELEAPTATGANDTPATAEAATAQGMANNFYTIDGSISAPGAGGDVDYISFVVPAGVTQYQVSCDAARTGSGLGGFTAQLYNTDGTTAIGAASTETATTDLVSAVANVPASSPAGTKWFLKVSAATQDATNKGTAYRCYVFFQ